MAGSMTMDFKHTMALTINDDSMVVGVRVAMHFDHNYTRVTVTLPEEATGTSFILLSSAVEWRAEDDAGRRLLERNRAGWQRQLSIYLEAFDAAKQVLELAGSIETAAKEGSDR